MENLTDSNKAERVFINALMIFNAGFAFSRMISGVLVNHVIEHFSLIGAEQGYMLSMINIGLTAAVISTVLIRWKIKKTSMIAVSGLVMVATMALTGMAGSFDMVLVVSLIFGVGVGWIDVYSNSSIIDVNRGKSAKNQSMMQGWFGIGAILAPIIIAALLTKNDWQGVFLTLAPGFLVIVVIYIICLNVAGKKIFNTDIEAVRIKGREVLSFLKRKKSILLLAGCFAYYTMQYGIFAWLVRYMSVQYGAEAIGITGITVMWICTSISRFIVPKLPVDNMKMHTYGAFTAAVTLFVGILSNNPWVMCIMVGIGALTTGNSLPTLMNRVVVTYEGSSLLPTSAMLISMQLTGMITPPVLGAISLYSYQGSMFLLVIAIIVSASLGLAFMRLKPETQALVHHPDKLI